MATQPWAPRTVGIALAAYRPNPEWLAAQLASIVAQTHTEWLCAITLDSPLRDIASDPALTPFMHDKRFTWVENPERLGLRANFEKAIEIVLRKNVDLISFSDQDDVWLPEKLAESVTAITTSGPLTMVYCDAYLLVDNTARTDRLHEYTLQTRGQMSVAEWIIQPQVSGFCMLFDAALVQLHPTIPNELPHHDHWYSLVAASYGGIFRIDEPLALYRQHSENTIGITAVRVAQGWNMSTALKKYSTLRENAYLRAGIARRVGAELPGPFGFQKLCRSSAGWFLILLGVIAKRLFSDQRLAANAYRKAWGLLLPETSQREFVQKVRKRLPEKLKIVRTALAAGVVMLVVVSLAAAQLRSLTSLNIVATVLACLFVASGLITALRYLQHQMPHTPMLLVGVGTFFGLLLLLFGAGPWLAIAAVVLPLFGNVCYRLRWMKRT